MLMMVTREAQSSAYFSTQAMLHSVVASLISLVVAHLRGSVVQSRFSDLATYFMKKFQHRTMLECLASSLCSRAASRIVRVLKKPWPELFYLRVIRARLANSASRSDSATFVWRPMWR